MPEFAVRLTAHSMLLTGYVAFISLFLPTHYVAAGDPILDEKDTHVLQSLKSQALNSDLSYEILESLTTEVGARLAGTPSDQKAIRWAVQKMQSLGFDKVWTEEVEIPAWDRGTLHVEISKPYQHRLTGLSLGGSIGTKGRALSGDVIEFADLDALQKAEPGSLKGKIAYISNRMLRHIEGRGYGVAVPARGAGASAAAAKGAKGLIIRSIGTDDHRFAHTGGMSYSEETPRIPAIAISNPDADLLSRVLTRGKASVTIKSTAERNDGKVRKTANVLGEITGSEAASEIVAIGAHLDSWDVGTGAMDDGLGVAITMAAAAMISKSEIKPKRTIRVILYGAEEIGFYGTKQYMIDHADNVAQHVIGAEWDFGLGRIYELRPGVGETALTAVQALGAHLLDLGVLMGKGNDAQAQSDMSLLSKAGMPAVNFMPDGSRYFDYHHTENDTLDKINPQDLKQNTAVYTVFAWFAAQSGVDFRR